MDSSLLDALECAICLNQLSESNRVLPCQHTFCFQCLKDVVSSHGLLHCPECRTPVDVPVDKLPQNIVLVRLLDTLKAAGIAQPAPQPVSRPVLERGVSCDGFAEGSYIRTQSVCSSSSGGTNPFLTTAERTEIIDAEERRKGSSSPHASSQIASATHSPAVPSAAQQANTADTERAAALAALREALAEFDPLSPCKTSISTPIAPSRNSTSSVSTASTAAPQQTTTSEKKKPSVPFARAIYDYPSTHEGDLAFKKGDVILLRRRIDFDWFEGQVAGKVGVFPANHVTVMTPLANHIPLCRALSQFTFPDQDGKTYLRFEKGEIMTVLRPVDAAWAEGKIGHRAGVFPLTLVELNSAAQSLLRAQGCATKSTPPSQAPPLPPPLPVRPARQRAAPSSCAAAAAAGQLATPPPLPQRPGAPPPRPLPALRTTNAGGGHHHKALTRDPQHHSESSLHVQSGGGGGGSAHAPTGSADSDRRPAPAAPSTPAVPDRSARLGRSGSSLSESRHRPLQRVRSWGAGSAPAPGPAAVADAAAAGHRGPSRSERKHSEVRRNYKTPTPLVIQRYRCTMDYPASSDVELPLRADDIVYVHKKRSDGWMKGTHEKTGHTGLFPAMFVEPC